MNNSSSAKVLTFVQEECISAFSQNRIIFKYRIRLFTRWIKHIMIHGLVYFSRFQLSSSIIFNDYNPATRISYDCQTFEFSDCSKCFALIKLFLIWSFPVKFEFFVRKFFLVIGQIISYLTRCPLSVRNVPRPSIKWRKSHVVSNRLHNLWSIMSYKLKI